MPDNFTKVKHYLLDLGIQITSENPEEELVVVESEDRGVKNLVIDCEDPILIIEQVIMPVPGSNPAELFKRLLQMNRELVHGAFVLDEEGKLVIFRDTLELENLDLNELEGSINALAMGLAEFGDELIKFHKEA